MKRLFLRVATATCLCSLLSFGEAVPRWRQFVQRGDQQRDTRALKEAEATYLTALRASENEPAWKAQAVCLNRLGLVYKAMGQYPAAERFSRRALDLWERHAEGDSREVIIAKTNLSIVLHAERKYREAERLLSAVLDVCLTEFGPGSEQTANALNNLGAVYHEQGRLRDAEALYRRVYDLYRGTAGPPPASVLLTGNNLALTLSAQGRWAEADFLFGEVLAHARTQSPLQADLESTLLNNIGLLRARQGNKEEAVRYLGEAVRLRDEQLGPEHPEAVETALNYATVLKQAKRNKEAARYSSRGSLRLPATVDVTSLLQRR